MSLVEEYFPTGSTGLEFPSGTPSFNSDLANFGSTGIGGMTSQLVREMQLLGYSGADIAEAGGNILNGLDAFSAAGVGTISPWWRPLVSTAPALAAIAYARNQNPYDTSRLTSLFGEYNPEAQANIYDVNTGLGRTSLTDSLARRGVSGSIFGDQSLTNFDTARGLERGSLINQGVGTSAGIAGQILNADAVGTDQRNKLYGRALLALSGGLAA
jgi:hypothetical protein